MSSMGMVCNYMNLHHVSVEKYDVENTIFFYVFWNEFSPTSVNGRSMRFNLQYLNPIVQDISDQKTC